MSKEDLKKELHLLIDKIDDEAIYVKCKDELESIKVTKEKWENIKYSLNQTNQQIEEEVIGSNSSLHCT